MIAAGLLLAVTAVFTPPRLLSGEPPGLPGPNVVAGGEVLVEAIVGTDGAVSRAIVLRTTPPYSQMLLDAVNRWRFEPAHVVDDKGVDHVVEAAVLVAAVYRSPNFFNGPSPGTPPLDLVRPSALAPYPVVMTVPEYPARAQFGSVVMLDLSLDEAGIARVMTSVHSNPGFDAAARDAVSRWQFRGASRLSLPVPSKVYVVLGFPTPVLADRSK